VEYPFFFPFWFSSRAEVGVPPRCRLRNSSLKVAPPFSLPPPVVTPPPLRVLPAHLRFPTTRRRTGQKTTKIHLRLSLGNRSHIFSPPSAGFPPHYRRIFFFVEEDQEESVFGCHKCPPFPSFSSPPTFFPQRPPVPRFLFGPKRSSKVSGPNLTVEFISSSFFLLECTFSPH